MTSHVSEIVQTISEKVQNMFDRCLAKRSTEMDVFMAKLKPYLVTFPEVLVPYVEYWARNPVFDSKGHPYLVIPKRIDNVPYKQYIRELCAAGDDVKVYCKIADAEIGEPNSKMLVPVVCNASYGGYSFGVELCSLLSDAGAHALVGAEKITYVPESDDPYGYEIRMASEPLASALPRHHLFLVAVVAVLGGVWSHGLSTYLDIGTVKVLCVDAYRIHGYDGSESIIDNEAKAIAMLACKIPDAKTASLEDLRVAVEKLQQVIRALRFD